MKKKLIGLLRKIKYRSRTAINTFLAKRKIKTYGESLAVNAKCVFTPFTEIGDHCNFNGMVIKGRGRVKIGDYFHSGTECLMITSFHNYDSGDAIPYDNTNIDKDVTIENNVWLGDRVIILGGVTIGEGAVIQAGSVVCKDVPALSIAGGHPAVAFKKRDEEHYYSLAEQGKFM